MAHESPEVLPAKPPRLWAYLIGVLVFRILNSLYWAFVGGLGWGFGSAAGSFLPWAGADTLGGAAGLACALLAVLTVSFEKKQFEYPPIYLAMFGGVAVGCATLLILNPFGRDWNLLLGAGAGFLLGVGSAVMKQHFSFLRFLPACMIAVTGSGLFAGIAIALGGHLGWGVAGAISLFAMAMFGVCWPRQPAVEWDASGQIVRFVPRPEMCRHTIRQSWSLLNLDAWGWNGLLAGLFASLWATWAGDHLNQEIGRQPFLWCGGLAAFTILGTRLGFLKPTEKAKDERTTTNDEKMTKPQ